MLKEPLLGELQQGGFRVGQPVRKLHVVTLTAPLGHAYGQAGYLALCGQAIPPADLFTPVASGRVWEERPALRCARCAHGLECL